MYTQKPKLNLIPILDAQKKNWEKTIEKRFRAN